jgi:peptidoglycan/LPS O-acetylase OafA/YrhL
MQDPVDYLSTSTRPTADDGDALRQPRWLSRCVRPSRNPIRQEASSFASLTSTASSAHLDLLRAVAAIAVMLGHVRNLFFVDLPEINYHRGILTGLIYYGTSFGHEAVMVFFVLSGFLVGGTVLRGVLADRFQPVRYAVNRLSRLWVVLLPALLLGAVIDRAGILVFGSRGVYGGFVHNHVVQYAVSPRLAPVTMLGNTFFLQDILVPSFGTNSALWSLSYEFWYYVLFPLIAIAILAERPILRFGCAIASVGIAVLVGKSIALYFLIWLLGAAINLAAPTTGRFGAGLLAWLSGCCLLLIPWAHRIEPQFNGFLADSVAGLFTALLICGILSAGGRASVGRYSRTAHDLAGFSYSLYVLHLPLLVLLSAWLAKERWQPDLGHLLAGAGVALFALAYARSVAAFTEFRTGSVRARLAAALGLSAKEFIPPSGSAQTVAPGAR